MRSVNARCVSIGLVLALSNCSESGGEPDAMLDMHHPGTGIDSHHPQFHNSYGNMKFIIIVINPTLGAGTPRNPRYRGRFSRSRSQRLSQVLRRSSRRVSFRSRPPVLFDTVWCCDAEHPSPTVRQTSFASRPPRISSTKRNVTHPSMWRIILPLSLPLFISKKFSLLLLNFCSH